jgi:hypothetical protein
MKKPIITAVLLSSLSAVALADTTAMMDNPPERHVVVKGDTLWSIAAKFLKDPWRWPEVWKMNQEQVKNPHRIYPGDVVVLDKTNGTLKLLPRDTVRLEPRVYSEPSPNAAIPAVDPVAIRPFLSQPLVIEANGLTDAPYIVATDEKRVLLGAGNTAFVHGIKEGEPLHWQIYQPGRALTDPDTNEVLGHEAVYLGDAKVLRHGEAATVEITKSVLEIRKNDRLVPMPKEFPNVAVPHAPEKALKGRIISAYGGVAEVGQNAIVTLNLGSRDGLEPGHVLALHRFGYDVATNPEYREARKDEKETVRLPDEHYGTVYVFRVFERLSYALVGQITRQANVGDVVATPPKRK